MDQNPAPCSLHSGSGHLGPTVVRHKVSGYWLLEAISGNAPGLLLWARLEGSRNILFRKGTGNGSVNFLVQVKWRHAAGVVAHRQNEAIGPVLPMSDDSPSSGPSDELLRVFANAVSNPFPVLTISKGNLRKRPPIMPEGGLLRFSLLKKKPPVRGHVSGTGLSE